MYNALGIGYARRVAVGGLSTSSTGLGVSVSEGMDMKGIALGLAVAGAAAFGFTGVASAQQAPAETGAVAVFCVELGFGGGECGEAVANALVAETVASVNAGLADLGIEYVVD
jgi:hypothetical protein